MRTASSIPPTVREVLDLLFAKFGDTFRPEEMAWTDMSNLEKPYWAITDKPWQLG